MKNDTLFSENEEESFDLDSDFEDSEDDWNPLEKENGGGPGKVTKISPKGGVKRKSTIGEGMGKKSQAKRAKLDDSEDEEDELDESDEELDEEEEVSSDGKAAKKSPSAKTKSMSYINSKAIPDKDGKFYLFIFKNDLSNDLKRNPKLCMWRRDGSSLLQKYLKPQDEDNTEDILFKSCTVYSCWNEKRNDDFLEIKVQCVGDKKDGVVKVLDIEKFTKFTMENRPVVDAGIVEEDGGKGDENECEEDEPDEEE